jgi:hypothetical protein
MTRAFARPLLIAGLLLGTTGLFAAQGAAQDSGGLATYKNDRHGFSLSYPAAQFIALPAPNEDGRQLLSKDGKARLLVGTLANFDNKSLGAYRTFLMAESFAGAKFDYAPVRDTWFVLSGTRGDMAFYQRVNFACGGRAINSWMITFPAAETATYQPIIEQVHRDYRLGTGNCAQRVTGVDKR